VMQLFANLIENALRHTRVVRLLASLRVASTRRTGQCDRQRSRHSGESARQGATALFSLGIESHHGRSGLGLSMVSAIVKVHDATSSWRTPRRGCGHVLLEAS